MQKIDENIKFKESLRLEEKYGTDQDEIMLMDDEDFVKASCALSSDFCSMNYYFDHDFYPTAAELYKNQGYTVDYLNSLINAINDINNFNKEELNEILIILNSLKLRFENLKKSLYSEIESTNQMIEQAEDYYRKYEYANEYLKGEREILNRCSNIINTLNQAITKVTEHVNQKHRD